MAFASAAFVNRAKLVSESKAGRKTVKRNNVNFLLAVNIFLVCSLEQKHVSSGEDIILLNLNHHLFCGKIQTKTELQKSKKRMI